MNDRIKRLQKILKDENLDAFLITYLPHVRYLSGYTGSNGIMVITLNSSSFLTDFRYKEQSKKQVKGSKITVVERDLYSGLTDIPGLKAQRIKLGYQAEFVSCKVYRKLKALLPYCLLVPMEQSVETLTIRKDRDEIENIKKAAEITDLVFAEILTIIRPGMVELDLAAEIEYRMKGFGSSTPYYETIVASGKRAALPHGVASNKKIQRGDFVTMDFGAVWDGYTADLTRTVIMGKATQRQKAIYNTVFKAQQYATSKVKAGIKACDLDKVARDIIKRAGYSKYFGHGLGHGIGLLIHDNPAINPTNQLVLEPGMVITVEPGIYIPNWGGVRIEDDVLVTQRGNEVLTNSDRKLLEL
jgi:Xaa-Pro aminopeptidase